VAAAEIPVCLLSKGSNSRGVGSLMKPCLALQRSPQYRDG